MTAKTCVYCGSPIYTKSTEHIIHNALGGVETSDDICCGKCNNKISSIIDKPFTNIFAPFIDNISNFSKSNNKNSNSSYDGIGIYQGKEYNCKIKNNHIISCSELCKMLQCNVKQICFSKVLPIININKNDLSNGLGKIAFSYAIHNGIDKSLLVDKLVVKKDNFGNLNNVNFRFEVIPFIPLNPFDEYIESKCYKDVYHMLILFNIGAQLWCYIDLFNCFQYYVLLSDSYIGNDLYKNYNQVIVRENFGRQRVRVRRMKDYFFYDQMKYGGIFIKNEANISNFITLIDKRSVKKKLCEIVSNRIGDDYLGYKNLDMYIVRDVSWRLNSLQFYYDENDDIRHERFRIFNFTQKRECINYPNALKSMNDNGCNKQLLNTYQDIKIKNLIKTLQQNGEIIDYRIIRN